jgi:tetratricopeptide (TPR) repeat protein
MAPSEWYIRKTRAEAFIATKQYLPALDDLAAAIELTPTDLSILTWSPLEVWTDCPDPAVRDRLMALAHRMVFLNSESPEALLVRAALYAAIKDFGKSDRDFKRAIEADSKNARPQFMMAITQLATGMSQEYRQTSEILKDFAMRNPLPTNLYLAGWTAALSDGSLSDVAPPTSFDGRTEDDSEGWQVAIGNRIASVSDRPIHRG